MPASRHWAIGLVSRTPQYLISSATISAVGRGLRNDDVDHRRMIVGDVVIDVDDRVVALDPAGIVLVEGAEPPLVRAIEHADQVEIRKRIDAITPALLTPGKNASDFGQFAVADDRHDLDALRLQRMHQRQRRRQSVGIDVLMGRQQYALGRAQQWPSSSSAATGSMICQSFVRFGHQPA